MTEWRELYEAKNFEQIAECLLAANPDLDLDELARNPLQALDSGGLVDLEIMADLPSSCGGGGYYRADPPTIYLHPSAQRRNNFTLLHELGHHLQQQHHEWGFHLLDLPADLRLKTEEKVSDAIASVILVPPTQDDIEAWNAHPADVMAGLYATTSASRSAVLEAMVKRLPSDAKWILAVAGLDGVVQHARSTYADLPPAKNSRQPGLAAVADEALTGPVRRAFTEGIRYNRGLELHDMRIEAVVDHELRYVFAALKPTRRFGVGTVHSPYLECATPACGETFEAKSATRYCRTCDQARCPACGRCGCDPAQASKCPQCGLRVVPGEIESGDHDCWG